MELKSKKVDPHAIGREIEVATHGFLSPLLIVQCDTKKIEVFEMASTILMGEGYRLVDMVSPYPTYFLAAFEIGEEARKKFIADVKAATERDRAAAGAE